MHAGARSFGGPTTQIGYPGPQVDIITHSYTHPFIHSSIQHPPPPPIASNGHQGEQYRLPRRAVCAHTHAHACRVRITAQPALMLPSVVTSSRLISRPASILAERCLQCPVPAACRVRCAREKPGVGDERHCVRPHSDVTISGVNAEVMAGQWEYQVKSELRISLMHLYSTCNRVQMGASVINAERTCVWPYAAHMCMVICGTHVQGYMWHMRAWLLCRTHATMQVPE